MLKSQKSAPRSYRIDMHILDDSNFVQDCAVWRFSSCVSMLSCFYDGYDDMQGLIQHLCVAMAEFCHMQRCHECKGVISAFVHAFAVRSIASSCAACCLDYVEDMHMHSQQKHGQKAFDYKR